ncbi:MAG: tRNA (guanosine(37)-N1)-methyltransferase TrmD [Spirochaetales bacterium]|nr:tRNA (guanosine(37)-N1)-methyltransferase TrmD [Spirochaetales bacterium]
MKWSVVTLFPEMFSDFLTCSIIGRAVEDKKLFVQLVNPRDFAVDKHRQCDDYPFGGGPGMVLKPEPVAAALDSLQGKGKRVIYVSPGGRVFDQEYARKLSLDEELILVCGHYEGIDQRIIDLYVTDEISIGDYILTSGETAAMVVIDAVSRLLDGVISDDSHDCESFSNGLLEYPQYTRPREFRGEIVPDILLSGHHEEIRKWRLARSIEKTMQNRPDLLEKPITSDEIRKILFEKGVEDNGTSKKS